MRITKLTKLIVPHIFISGVNSTIHVIAHMLVDIFYWGRGNLWSSIGQAYINIKSLTGTCSIVSLMQCLLPTSWNEHNRVLLLTKLKLPWNHMKSHAWSVKNDLWNNENDSSTTLWSKRLVRGAAAVQMWTTGSQKDCLTDISNP